MARENIYPEDLERYRTSLENCGDNPAAINATVANIYSELNSKGYSHAGRADRFLRGKPEKIACLKKMVALGYLANLEKNLKELNGDIYINEDVYSSEKQSNNGKMKKFFHSAFYGQNADGVGHLSLLFAIIVCAMHMLIYFYFPQKLPEEHFLCKLVCNIETIAVYHHDKGLVNHAIAFMYKYVIPFFGFIVAVKCMFIATRWRKIHNSYLEATYFKTGLKFVLATHLLLAFMIFIFLDLRNINPYNAASHGVGKGGFVGFGLHPEGFFSEVFFSLLMSFAMIITFACLLFSAFIWCSIFLEQIKKIFSLIFK